MARIKVSGTNLTKHFTFAEYAKNQTGTVKLTAAAILQAQCMEEFRQWLGKPMQINSWFRTAAYNKKIGGNAKSSHLCGGLEQSGRQRKRFYPLREKMEGDLRDAWRCRRSRTLYVGHSPRQQHLILQGLLSLGHALRQAKESAVYTLEGGEPDEN